MPNLPALTPTTFAEAMQFANELAKSTMVPRDFQRNPANILVAIQWGAELGLGPLQALQNIAVINGKPSVYGDAMLALVKGSPLCEDVIERFEGEGENRVAICEALRKGKAPVIAKFSVADARAASLWKKAGPWSQYPDRMLKMRARGFALRDQFADILRGVISAEEAADISREPPKDITPPSAPTVAAELDAFAADLARDQAEANPLLVQARGFAQQGDAAFRAWYFDTIDDAQRTALRPHINALKETMRAADTNQGEVDMGLASDPVHPPPESPRDQPVSEEPGRPEGSLMPVILPSRGPTGRVNWMHYANEVLDAARLVDPLHMHEFRVAHASSLNSLRISNKEEWDRVTQKLAALERGEDTEDERNLKDE